MHLVAVDVHLFQTARNFLYLFLLTREDDDTLQVALFEDVVDDLQFLRIIADIGALVNLLGRF